jgi:hypothetical protein
MPDALILFRTETSLLSSELLENESSSRFPIWVWTPSALPRIEPMVAMAFMLAPSASSTDAYCDCTRPSSVESRDQHDEAEHLAAIPNDRNDIDGVHSTTSTSQAVAVALPHDFTFAQMAQSGVQYSFATLECFSPYSLPVPSQPITISFGIFDPPSKVRSRNDPVGMREVEGTFPPSSVRVYFINF